ncbi:MAG: enoyl-CoA hydratase-related protein [Daejeonella sp.]|uniref:enoyl-CoA hydratase/isomerase family protein n=1 Tax=Daejeonella sp. TaxID=2805397 RepID=UPI0027368F60|nr:enoyl-CoA hydratase-related protein [Daejeonella sp.]MDP3467191.1 enoyl-CoA hydratase-related protein [Daejeonella sp.]
MNYSNLLIENRERILYITINRENKLNALNKATLAELHDVITGSAHDEEVGGLIISGAGQKAFVAGADISEFADFNADEGRELAREGQIKVFDVIQNHSKPIIAAINGFALGGGLELALACHIRVAASGAKMGLPEVSLGLIPGYGGTQRLTELIGKGRAMEMILTGDMVNADDAYRTGLINHVYEPENLLNMAAELMKKILTRSPFAVSCAIRAINAASAEGINGYETEISEFSNCFGSDDFREGVSAFLAKRKAEFRGK